MAEIARTGVAPCVNVRDWLVALGGDCPYALSEDEAAAARRLLRSCRRVTEADATECERGLSLASEEVAVSDPDIRIGQ